MPSGFTSKIKAIHSMDGELEEAFAPMSCTITLEDEIDISRGDMLVKPDNQPEQKQDVDVMICWLNKAKLKVNGKYALKHTTKDARAIVKEVKYKVDINTLHRIEDDKEIEEAHESTAQEGQSNMVEDVNTHFVAFVHRAGHLYEMDGRKDSPINHGSSSQETLLADACRVIQQEFMAKDPEEVRFTMTALAPLE
jgi:translation elongation factor EF-1alpha